MPRITERLLDALDHVGISADVNFRSGRNDAEMVGYAPDGSFPLGFRLGKGGDNLGVLVFLEAFQIEKVILRSRSENNGFRNGIGRCRKHGHHGRETGSGRDENFWRGRVFQDEMPHSSEIFYRIAFFEQRNRFRTPAGRDEFYGEDELRIGA